MSQKPPHERASPVQNASNETQSHDAGSIDRNDPPFAEIVNHIKQVADRFDALCTHMQLTQCDDSLVSSLCSRLDNLEAKLDQLSTYLVESRSSLIPVEARRATSVADQPPEPAPADESVVEFLVTSSPFSMHGANDCSKLAQFMDRIVLASDSVLFSQGQIGDALYVIKSGRLEIYKTDESGEVHVADVQPGEVVGEMALIEDLPRSASVRAKETAELLVLSRDSFRDLEKSYPPCAVKLHKELLAILSARLRKATDTAVGRRDLFC